MKHILFVPLFFLSIFIFGQNNNDNKTIKWNNKIYFNESMEEVKEKNAIYYLLININANGLPIGKAQMFKVKGNILFWEGSYFLFNKNEPKKNKLQGLCTWYYSNKKKSRESFFKDGVLDGKTTFYNEGEKVIYTGNYKNGKLDDGKMTQYNEDGTTNKVYFQNFDNYYDGWEEEVNKDGEVTIKNGILLVSSKNDDGFVKKEYIPIETSKDFSMETTFKFGESMSFRKADHFTILYGFADFQNYYSVTVSTRGYIMIENHFEGINLIKPSWLTSKLNQDWNTLKILKLGEDVYISMNGNVITSYKFSKFYGSYFGFLLKGKNQEVAFENIMAKEFPYKSRSAGGNSQSKDERPSSNIDRKSLNDNNIEWRPAGTGFYIASNGLVFTNYHVIENAKNIGITQFSEGRKSVLKAKVILTDEQNDLALLQIEDSRFISPGPIPYILDPKVAEVGESIFTMGYPLTDILGDEIKITDGIISSRSGILGDTRVYQITAPITYGNSGGPLLDKDGNLIGINSRGITNKSLAENTGFSIKSTLILNLLSSLNDPPKISSLNLLKGKLLKDQIRILKNFVPMICTN